MKEDKFTKSLAKNQVCAIFHLRDVRKNVLPKFVKLCIETPSVCVPSRGSLLLRRFVFRMAEASAKRVTGDEPQGTMGRVQTGGARCLLPAFLCAHVLKRDVWVRGSFKGYKYGRRKPTETSVFEFSY